MVHTSHTSPPRLAHRLAQREQTPPHGSPTSPIACTNARLGRNLLFRAPHQRCSLIEPGQCRLAHDACYRSGGIRYRADFPYVAAAARGSAQCQRTELFIRRIADGNGDVRGGCADTTRSIVVNEQPIHSLCRDCWNRNMFRSASARVIYIEECAPRWRFVAVVAVRCSP